MLNSRQKAKELVLRDAVPLLPLRDMVVFPSLSVPLFVGRSKSIRALEEAMLSDRLIFLCSQRHPSVEDPREQDLYEIGCVAEVTQFVKMGPEGSAKAMVQGLTRARVREIISKDPCFMVRLEVLRAASERAPETEALMRHVYSRFEAYVKGGRKIPPEVLLTLHEVEDAGDLADLIASHLPVRLKDKQSVLETADPMERLEKVSAFIESESEMMELERRIQGRVRRQMEKSQKEYYLQEQIKAIQKELGQREEAGGDIEELRKKIKEAHMTQEAEDKAIKELERLTKMPALSAEGTVVRTYLDWLISLPWAVTTKDKIEVNEAEKILNEDHYGLSKVKDRILEYLSVRKLVPRMKGPILCFVGPPGVGKTSLARSVARALGRKFVRLSLGGVRDEAEIRGHRRTYIGALPGRILQGMKKAKSKNPVFLLDEIDKMSSDFRGDPAAALLEVLDPEQNHTFNDHYLDVDFDLSQVLFITTANTLYPVPPPLQDRLEIINLPGYTVEEKLAIARKFLIPKQLKDHGLKKANLKFTGEALTRVVEDYTREAGVRNLEREIASLCRKAAKQVVKKGKKTCVTVTAKGLAQFLGIAKYRQQDREKQPPVGVATGLAWTETGGDVLSVEVSILRGRGNLTLTGKLGEVMRESAQAALSYTRSRARDLGIPEGFYKTHDVHIHVPEGAIPKDGPSAGITIAAALSSALLGKPLKKGLAMTGEITLRGRVLAIGGLKEKVLAAHRWNMNEIICPRQNQKDMEDIPAPVRQKMKFHFVDTMDQVLAIAFHVRKNAPRPKTASAFKPAVIAEREQPAGQAMKQD